MIRRLGLAALLFVAGCHLYLWAGDHELELPPGPKPTPTVAPTPYPTPESRY